MYEQELHDLISIVPDGPFGPHIGIALHQTPTTIRAVKNPYLYTSQPLPPSHVVFRSELLWKSRAAYTRAAYNSDYEQFCYAYPSASAADLKNLDQKIAQFIEDQYQETQPNASPQKIRNFLAIIAITASSLKGKIIPSAIMVNSLAKNRTPFASAPWM